MKILLFGGTGMVGQGVLREALRDTCVKSVMSVVRRPGGVHHAKLRELVLDDLMEIGSVRDRLEGFDAGLFCVGVSAAGLSEEAYTRQTYDLTMKVAGLLATLNPDMTFLYVSGAGTDSSEHGRFMWARVKGRTENALLRLPFKASHMFRPGMIQPLYGIRSRTAWYNVLYAVAAPLASLLVRRFPGVVTTTEQLGRAMIGVARNGHAKSIIETSDINDVR